MIIYPIAFDAVVVGGGHAGCEAAWALAQRGFKALLISLDIDRIAQMSCNPSIGGIAKGHITKEIDALGGLMARVADASAIQYRTLNASKGPAVRSSRVQCDTQLYKREMLRRLSEHPNIALVQAKVEDVLLENGAVSGVLTSEGVLYPTKCAVLCTGTFLRGLCHIGEHHFEAGRSGDGTSEKLSGRLEALGIELKRLKTGTPPRISAHSLDFSQFEVQPGDDVITRLSFYGDAPLLPQVPCHIAYTTERTHEIIREARERSPLFNGTIHGIGPRYCPSIEDKVFRFADKDRHQIFIEPMGLDTDEIYPAGISSSLPFDVQLAFIHSIPGFERAHVIRPAYAVEYDAIESGQMMHNMALREIPSIFVAGQINCTSGYEEAAAQGLMAGINAACWLRGEEPFILRRNEAYIGVMIDDLVMRGADEPYRMFTSRAEFRLSLREDNADARLAHYGHQYGLLSDADYQKTVDKLAQTEALKARLPQLRVADIDKTRLTEPDKLPSSGNLGQLVKMPEVSIEMLAQGNEEIASYAPEVRRSVEISYKFDGYIQREAARIEAFVDMENRKIPKDFDYRKVHGLTTEVLTKLEKYRPSSLGEAGRISGVTPAAINAIWIVLR
ncbi:MAG: tRNA uridine-5-carboxymethylaminomethyl(34) synthesis enzyme MnmG [Proteobacteria bacterium]|nr:tRNA uridine-5-carboxymethylaminomethyl(34) synthesis enzyme MnmG [Pseudomonadota bacterium]